MKFVDEFRDAAAIRRTADEIRALADPDRTYRFMEVCGGHTHSIYRFALKDLLPANVELVHGPGCPVCVLPMGRIDDGLAMAKDPKVVFTAFGVYFSGMVALIVMRSLGGADMGALVDVGGNCLYVVCLATGAYWFSARGEQEERDPRLADRAEHAAALRTAYGRLEHLDGELLRTLAR